jgi:hypothetical protein
MSVYQNHHWVRAYLVRSPVEVVEEEINLRSLKDMIGKSQSMANTNKFARGKSPAESSVDKPTISSKILSTFRGKQTGRG